MLLFYGVCGGSDLNGCVGMVCSGWWCLKCVGVCGVYVKCIYCFRVMYMVYMMLVGGLWCDVVWFDDMGGVYVGWELWWYDDDIVLVYVVVWLYWVKGLVCLECDVVCDGDCVDGWWWFLLGCDVLNFMWFSLWWMVCGWNGLVLLKLFEGGLLWFIFIILGEEDVVGWFLCWCSFLNVLICCNLFEVLVFFYGDK